MLLPCRQFAHEIHAFGTKTNKWQHFDLAHTHQYGSGSERIAEYTKNLSVRSVRLSASFVLFHFAVGRFIRLVLFLIRNKIVITSWVHFIPFWIHSVSSASTSVLLHRHCAVNKSIFVKVDGLFFPYFFFASYVIGTRIFGQSLFTCCYSTAAATTTTTWNRQVNKNWISSYSSDLLVNRQSQRRRQPQQKWRENETHSLKTKHWLCDLWILETHTYTLCMISCMINTSEIHPQAEHTFFFMLRQHREKPQNIQFNSAD